MAEGGMWIATKSVSAIGDGVSAQSLCGSNIQQTAAGATEVRGGSADRLEGTASCGSEPEKVAAASGRAAAGRARV